jgi:hypothetical protein
MMTPMRDVVMVMKRLFQTQRRKSLSRTTVAYASKVAPFGMRARSVDSTRLPGRMETLMTRSAG